MSQKKATLARIIPTDDSDVSAAKRGRLTKKQRLAVYENNGGRCHICGQRIRGGEAWEADHYKKAVAQGGTSNIEDFKPAHKGCHAVKTKADNKATNKAKRVKQKHLGIWEPKGKPMPGSKRSKWKRKMDGTIERRDK